MSSIAERLSTFWFVFLRHSNKYCNAKFIIRFTIAVSCQICRNARNWIIVSFYFVRRIHIWQLFIQNRGDFRCIKDVNISFFHLFDSNLINFESIDALTVLIDELHNILKKMMQGFALKIQANKVSGVMAICLQQFLYGYLQIVPRELLFIILFILIILKSQILDYSQLWYNIYLITMREKWRKKRMRRLKRKRRQNRKWYAW